jgi:hypothetical protein
LLRFNAHCQVLVDLQKVKGSPPCAAVGASLEAEVGGVISIVRSLGEGVGPEAHTILNFSNFYKSCIKKLENCYWVQANVDGDGVSRRIFGRKALHYQMREIADKLDKKEEVDLVELKSFRTFSWLLTKEERDQTSTWISSSVASHMLNQKAIKSGAPPSSLDGGGSVLAVPGPSVPLSSSSSSSKAAPLQSITATIELLSPSAPSAMSVAAGSQEKKKVDKAIAAKANIMKLFVGKGVVKK